MKGEKKEDYLPEHIQELQKRFPADKWWILKDLPRVPLQISAYLDHEDGTLGVALTLRLTIEQAERLLEQDNSQEPES